MRKKSSLCFVLMAAMAVSLTACVDTLDGNGSTVTTTTASATAASTTGTTAAPTPTEMGMGRSSFLFTVTDKEGNITEFEVFTDEFTVGETLLNLDLIDGEQGEEGLFVTTVNGIPLDEADEGYSWVFYVDGIKASVGVDVTDVTQGATYEFKYELSED